MLGKHKNIAVHLAAHASRWALRRSIASVVSWEGLPTRPLRPGCTAIIGMCCRLPGVLAANLRCLYNARWPALTDVVIAVDTTREAFADMVDFEALASLYPAWNMRFVFYSEAQAATAEAKMLPFVYSWLSWCLALREVSTQDVLIHDYDALIIGGRLADRYQAYLDGQAVVQGIKWYESNGIDATDRLATTFEMFARTDWLRSEPPIALFNNMRIKNGRSLDYDTTLELQDCGLPVDKRQIATMANEDLVHPSQMIHQYTMFRRVPGGRLPCFSMPMIPFFQFAGGDPDALQRAAHAITNSPRDAIDLPGDGSRMNLDMLDLSQVDWCLKQMVQACLALAIAPDESLHRLGVALYQHVAATPAQVWLGDFTPAQRAWIAQSVPAAQAA